MVMSLFTAGMGAIADDVQDPHTHNQDGWTCTETPVYGETPDNCTAHVCGLGACVAECTNPEHPACEVDSSCVMGACILAVAHVCSIDQGCFPAISSEWACLSGTVAITSIVSYNAVHKYDGTEVPAGGGYTTEDELKLAVTPANLYNGAWYTFVNYTTVPSEDGASATVYLNYTQEVVTIRVVKWWQDLENRYDMRPTEILVLAYNTNDPNTDVNDPSTAVGSKILSSPANTADLDGYNYPAHLLNSLWQGIITLPRYGTDGQEASYEFRDKVTNYLNTPGTQGNFVNEDKDESMLSNLLDFSEIECVFVQKIWGGDNSATRPTEITIYVENQDGVRVATIKLEAKDNWKAAFPYLPGIVSGVAQTYTIKEVPVPGYIFEGNVFTITQTPTGSEIGSEANPIVITNRVPGTDPEYVSLKVIKVWDTSVPANDLPAFITVELYADGKATGKTLNLVPDSWENTFRNLDKYANNGSLINYSIVELNPGTFTPRYGTVTKNGNNYEIVLTNFYEEPPEPEYVRLNVQKIWDSSVTVAIMPEYITVELYENGRATGETRRLNEGNDWYGSFTNLPKHDAEGSEISYFAIEIDAGDFTVFYGEVERIGDDYTLAITNSYEEPPPLASMTPPPTGTGTLTTIEDKDPPLSDSPKTGDGVNPILMWALLAAGILGMGLVLTLGRKKKMER